jgi:hypothetical protein
MTKEEKFDKIAKNFSLLPDRKQDYILGVVQALTFAHEVTTEQIEIDLSDSEQNTESI